jgi:hypothetical protein
VIVLGAAAVAMVERFGTTKGGLEELATAG